MSYILEALRRADAERAQVTGAVTSSLPVRTPGAQSEQTRWAGAPRGWRLGLMALAAVVALWWFTRAPQEPPPEPAPQRAAPSPAPQIPAGAEGQTEMPPSTESPAVSLAVPAEPILAPQAEAPVRVVTAPAPRKAAPKPESGPVAPPPDTAALSPSAAPAATSAAPASAPPLKVTGASYSDNPAHRMLIINGRVVAEGQEVEPGLTLEVITPRSAVLNHRGARFNINY